MKESRRVSLLMLERYRLGEVSAEERKTVEAELAADRKLRFRYEALEDSDRELRRLYPWEQSPLRFAAAALRNASVSTDAAAPDSRFRSRRFTRRLSRGRLLGLCAAALIVCVFFPSLYYLREYRSGAAELGGVSGNGGDRVKGKERNYELSIYLKDETADETHKLSDRALLAEGSTVQLSYTTPPGDIYYGVIFSIDGRSALTLHYPYRRGQSPVLTAGKMTFLAEAYTLDDAPDFEIFFMVASGEPLNTEDILREAQSIADKAKQRSADAAFIEEEGRTAFKNCEVETLTVLKK